MPNRKRDLDRWRRQWVGALLGAALGLILATLFPPLAERFGLISVVLWSAAIVAVLSSLGDFARAGAALTHSQNRLLNMVVGFGLPISLLLMFAYLVGLLLVRFGK